MSNPNEENQQKSWEAFAAKENFSAGQKELLKTWREIYSWLSDYEFLNEMKRLGRAS